MQAIKVESTKDRILETTAELFRRYGYTGTGLKQIVAQANAPFGSLYHFFPGGKAHLGEEVIRRSGQMYQELVEAVWDGAPDVLTARVFDSWIASATERLAAAGIPKSKARELAIAMIALLEGAFVLSRAMRSTEPLEVAGATASAAVREALEQARS